MPPIHSAIIASPDIDKSLHFYRSLGALVDLDKSALPYELPVLRKFNVNPKKRAFLYNEYGIPLFCIWEFPIIKKKNTEGFIGFTILTNSLAYLSQFFVYQGIPAKKQGKKLQVMSPEGITITFYQPEDTPKAPFDRIVKATLQSHASAPCRAFYQKHHIWPDIGIKPMKDPKKFSLQAGICSLCFFGSTNECFFDPLGQLILFSDHP